MKPEKDEIARRFGQAARAYGESPGHAYGADLGLLVEMVSPQSDMSVLDVATGAGHTAAALAPYVSEVIASDLSAGMVEETRRLFAERGLTNAKAVVMDSELLDFPHNRFDLVTCRIAAHHFLDPQKAVNAIASVLKPNGRFALEDSCSPPEPELDRFINKVETLRDPTHIRAYTEAEWRDMLAQAGLEVADVKFYRKSHNIEEWLDRLGAAPPDKAAVYRAFAEASQEAKRYFDLRFDGEKAVSYTDDKIIIISVRQEKSQKD